MQSIDDEIPDLSGPVSLGMYKFTRRGRSKKYETHKLSELQNVRDKESEKKVTVAAPTSSAHPPFDLTPPTTLSSSQLSEHPRHQTKAALSDNILNLNRSDNSSPGDRGFHEPGPRQSDEPGLIHSAAEFSESVDPTYYDGRSFEASGQAKSSFPSTQDYRSYQDSTNPYTPSSKASEQIYSSFPLEYHRSHLDLTPTVKFEGASSHAGFAQANNSALLNYYTPDQNFNAWTDSDRQGPQVSRQVHPPLTPLDRQSNTSQKYSQLTRSLNALIKPNGKGSKASTQATSRHPAQDFQSLISRLYRKRVGKTDDLLETHRESSEASSQPHLSAAPKGYTSPQSLPLSDTLPTASFNLETNQWDPDLPEPDMSAQTPTNKSILGSNAGHSSGKASSQVSYASQDARIPFPIITTTKSGRPYTNPYMPIYPAPSAARQTLRENPSGEPNRIAQTEDAELIERQRKTRNVDQEKPRYGVLGQAKQGHVKEPLDDPFQDQTTDRQQPHGQPSNYAGYAASQAAYGQSPGYHYQPTPTYATDPHASSFFSDEQQDQRALGTAFSPWRNQLSAYEPQSSVNSRAQISGIATHEQRPGYEQANSRASVRLPAVKGTTEQQKNLPNDPVVGSLSLEDSIITNAQDPRRRQTQGGIQPASSRVSHAIPIRDPAAYTGSGLTSRRNQDALRQNLDTVVASSQGSTGAPRTVMNDPHRDRQPSARPSSTATDATVTASTLRAQAPSYEFANTQRPETIDQPRQGATQRQGMAALGGIDSRPLHAHTSYASKSFERDAPNPEVMYRHEKYQTPAVPPGLGYDASAIARNAGLPNEAIGAGNAFMNELKAQFPSKRNTQQRLEDSQEWFRHDSRDLSYAAAVLPYETMNIMNPGLFPMEDKTPRSVSQLTTDSQDDDPNDRARQTATPRPIGHGRPAGFATPPSNHGPRRVTAPTPFSTLAGVSSAKDKDAMAHSGREFLRNDAQAIEAMFGSVYGNLMAGRNGPSEYLNHYGTPPAYAIDHNARNDHTLFDPQWFATAPPPRVGRDPRREQGEYEDPTTQGIAGRGRGEDMRRDSGGRGGGGGFRGWGRNCEVDFFLFCFFVGRG